MVGITCICKWFGYFLVQGVMMLVVSQSCRSNTFELGMEIQWFKKVKADRSCNQSIHQGSSQQVSLSRCFQTVEDYIYIYIGAGWCWVQRFFGCFHHHRPSGQMNGTWSNSKIRTCHMGGSTSNSTPFYISYENLFLLGKETDFIPVSLIYIYKKRF